MLDRPLMATRNVASALSGAVTARGALGRTRAACEDWPRLHPFEGRQHMSTDTDVDPVHAARIAGLFDYVATMRPTGFTVQFPIGYVIDHDSAGPAHCATLYFQGEMLGDFRFLSNMSPAALAEELGLWLDGMPGTIDELQDASWGYAPGMLHVIDDGQADIWARQCTLLIMSGPYGRWTITDEG